ncbi:chromosome condensation condensin complex subunit G [Encephalitozoon intestinalis ATCC 50506]|uniref:Chromosome condensation condensin complex subunit G n=1 Tax=Encephalitozoon intestinalis (strain ATCC 50506) TaxID=876142 RepID=E0S8J6_ENCIT|nr:chromosome condensation condensin complex subunit G [Encephalitozoon intestinalis ATCC 50506]ADM11990.1 chromosome condensation condensin complex subunit G [Encephalitozoon intestinalis ATCC 50506]UTX45777.1 CAPG-like protein [Encephalitozoon intestinalis]
MTTAEACNLERMQLIFNEIQQCDTKRYSETLKEMVEMLTTQELFEEFCKVINIILVCKRTSIPSRISNFLRRTFEDVSDVPKGAEFVLQVFCYLSKLAESKIAKVRKNSLSLLRLLTETVGPEAIGNGFLERISERLFDKEKGVRKEALKVLSSYQGMELNPKVRIVNLFKDIVRHDPSDEVRALALSLISIDQSTYGCITERCMDANESIRKMFYENCLLEIDLKGLSQDRRILLMEKAILEREFDAKGLLIDAILAAYKLPSELKAMNESFYSRSSQRYLETLLRGIFERVGCEKEFGYLLSEPSEENTFLSRVELLYIEEFFGRDDLQLPDLESFVTVMYQSCLSVVESRDALEREVRVEAMKNLFKIARFYDFFNETSRKYILSAVYKLLGKNSVEEVVEEAMQIASLVCDDDLNSFIGSIIKKNAKASPRVCLMVCKQVMKHIHPFGQLHEAIIEEIVLPNLGLQETVAEILEVGFYYVLNKTHHAITQSLIHNIEADNKVLKMCVDLALSPNGEELLSHVLRYIEKKLEDGESEDIIIPGSKIVLSKTKAPKELREKFIAFALERYYHTQDDHLKQYCSILFFELFSEDSSLLTSVFCGLLEALGSSCKVFIDQSLYWIGNSRYPNGSQLLFYNICVYLAGGYGKDQTKKTLLKVLERIEVLRCWDPRITKKILFCCPLMAKKLGGRFNVSEVTGRLREIDDGVPISPEDLCDVRKDLEN